MPTDASSIPSWVSLLIQVPLVGVFIWYSLEMNKRQQESQEKYMSALDKRDEAFERRNASVIASIDRLNQAIVVQLKEIQNQHDEHDRYVRDCEARRTSRQQRTAK